MGFVEQLIGQESSRCRFFQQVAEDAILQTVCAMLNGEGGWIVVGVADNNQIVGVDNAEQAVLNVQKSIAQKISPPALVYVCEELAGEKKVVLLNVIKGSSRIYSYNQRIFIMQDDSILTPGADTISCMMRTNKVCSLWEQQTMLAADEDDIDEQLIVSVQERARKLSLLRDDMAKDTADFLAGLQLANAGSLSNGAVALFGKKIEKLLPQSKIRIQAMFDGSTSSKYNDVRVLTGNILTLPAMVREYFLQTLPRIAQFSNIEWQRNDDYLYPLDVLDEMVVNAIVHRDYSDRYEEITILIYADKIVCKNPGEMDSSIIRDIKKGYHHSILRNPIMANVLYLDGLMEKTGRGINLIKQGMLAMRYRTPEWQSNNGYTTITLYCDSIRLNDRTRQFVATHKIGEVFSRQEYQVKMGISEVTAKKDIKLMLNQSLVEPEGKGRGIKYRLCRKYTE